MFGYFLVPLNKIWTYLCILCNIFVLHCLKILKIDLFIEFSHLVLFVFNFWKYKEIPFEDLKLS